MGQDCCRFCRCWERSCRPRGTEPRKRLMALQTRRVVTGHDSSGRAVVKIDDVARNLVSSRAGATACVVWTTEGFPVDNTGGEDAGLRKTGTTLDTGTA